MFWLCWPGGWRGCDVSLDAAEHGKRLANRVDIDSDGKVGEGGGLGADALNDHANQFGARAAADDENGRTAVAWIDIRVDQEPALSLGCAERVGGNPATAQNREGTCCARQHFRVTQE